MDSKQIAIAVVVTLAVLTITYIVKKELTKKYTMKLMKAVIEEDDEKFDQIADSFMVKMLFEPFNREFLRLNRYIAKGSDKKVKEQLSLIEGMRTSRNQRLTTYQTVFQYFLSTDNVSNAKNIQRKINAFVDEYKLDEEIKRAVDMDVRMFFDHDLSTIPYIDEKLADCSDQEKAVWNYRKAYVLNFNSKHDEAMACMQEVLKYTTDPMQKEIMQKIVDNDLKDL